MLQPFPPRHREAGRAAFLLVEAALAAAAIAIGLVAISRGLGSSLSTLASLQRRDEFLGAAESTLQMLRAEAQQAPPLSAERRRGSCSDMSRDCEWELTHEPFAPPGQDLPSDALRLVTLTVRRDRSPPGTLRLRTLWPGEWLAE